MVRVPLAIPPPVVVDTALFCVWLLFVCLCIASQLTLSQLRLRQYTTPVVYVSSMLPSHVCFAQGTPTPWKTIVRGFFSMGRLVLRFSSIQAFYTGGRWHAEESRLQRGVGAQLCLPHYHHVLSPTNCRLEEFDASLPRNNLT